MTDVLIGTVIVVGIVNAWFIVGWLRAHKARREEREKAPKVDPHIKRALDTVLLWKERTDNE